MMRLREVVLSSIWILLILMPENTLTETLCETKCKCTFDSSRDLTSLSCTNTSTKTVKNFINGLKQGMKYCSHIEISNTHISETDQNLFANFKGDKDNFFRLILTYNGIESIFANSFDNFPNLEYLNLRHNNITFIDTFKGSYSIRTLDLGFNKLQSLNGSVFQSLNNLESLYINNNQLKKISRGMFSGFSSHNFMTLDLSHNEIYSIEDFQTLNNLYNLNVSFENSYISRIGTDTFMGLNALKTLKLNSNNLEDVFVNMFQNLPQLETLDLNNNKISSLNPESFAGLISLRNLLLHNNKIRELPLGIFTNFPLLKNLQLGNNQILYFKTGSFSNLGNLKQLNFSHNSFSALNETVMYPLKNLELLDLDDNNFSYINYTSLLEHLPNLKFISVNNNKWNCVLLTHMLKTFRTAQVDYLFNGTSRYTEENVDGILCTETEEQIRTSSAVGTNENEGINNVQLQQLEWKIGNCTLLRNILNALNNISDDLKTSIQKDHCNQALFHQNVNYSSNGIHSTDSLEDRISYLDVVNTCILLSLICMCVLLSIMVYKIYFNSIRSKKRMGTGRSEIELLNASTE